MVINNYNNNNNEKLVYSRKTLKWKNCKTCNCTARNKLIQVVIDSMIRNEVNSVHPRITASP